MPFAVPKGASEQRVSLGALDPTTLFALDPAVSILAATYDGGIDQQSTLRRAIGRDLLFVRGPAAADTTRATLLAVDPERYRYADGSVGFQAPGMARFPADLVIVDPTVRLSLRSAQVAPDPRPGLFHHRRRLAGELPGHLGRRQRAGDGVGGGAVEYAQRVGGGPPAAGRGCRVDQSRLWGCTQQESRDGRGSDGVRAHLRTAHRRGAPLHRAGQGDPASRVRPRCWRSSNRLLLPS